MKFRPAHYRLRQRQRPGESNRSYSLSRDKYDLLIKSFCEQTQRTFVEKTVDGQNYRWNFIASALRTHSTSIIEVILSACDGGITFDEIEDRAKLYDSCDSCSICAGTYYFG